MPDASLRQLVAQAAAGDLVPYLGPGALFDAVDATTGMAMPASSDALILAMNGGRPMAPKLMYEFPRAAMNLEFKKGRSFIVRFLTDLYGRKAWSAAAVHHWVASLDTAYVIDTNRDAGLQALYAQRPHLLVVGLARLGGTDYRFRLHRWDGARYEAIEPTLAQTSLPVLFKPLGSPRPEPSFVASDADFVDYLTELMGGFAVPGFLKQARRGRRYLLLGLSLTRDTERMVLADLIHGAGCPAGYAVIAEPTPKEQRFCQRLGIEIVRGTMADLAEAIDATAATPSSVAPL